jgi:hypothetical protein
MYIVFLRSVLRLLVTANAVPWTLILVVFIMETICSSERSVLTTGIRHNISEDGILLSHRRESLRSYKRLITSLNCSNRTVSVMSMRCVFCEGLEVQ